MLCDPAHALAIARKLNIFPCCANAHKARAQIGVRGIVEALDGIRTCAGRAQIVSAVMVEEAVQQVGSVVDKLGFLVQMLVRVDQCGGLDMRFEIGHGFPLPIASRMA